MTFAVVDHVTVNGNRYLDVVTAKGCEGCFFERRTKCTVDQSNTLPVCASPKYREKYDGIVVFIPAGTLDQFVADRVTKKLTTGETP